MDEVQVFAGSQYDLLVAEVGRLRSELNRERLRNAEIQDQLEGMISDMSLMEDTIRELRGDDPEALDYGP